MLAVMLLIGGAYYIKKYAPTKEHMELSDYFTNSHDNEAVVILNGEYKTVSEEESAGYAIVKNDNVFNRDEEVYRICTKCGYVWK